MMKHYIILFMLLPIFQKTTYYIIIKLKHWLQLIYCAYLISNFHQTLGNHMEYYEDTQSHTHILIFYILFSIKHNYYHQEIIKDVWFSLFFFPIYLNIKINIEYRTLEILKTTQCYLNSRSYTYKKNTIKSCYQKVPICFWCLKCNCPHRY